jgi:UPF0176 protein
MPEYRIISFYEFREMTKGSLTALRDRLRLTMRGHSIKGTIILADEGFNATVSGLPLDIERFVPAAEKVLDTSLEYKSSSHPSPPFRRVDVKIKPEIVTLKRNVDITRGREMHVPPRRWNEVISDPDTVVLDTRNDYEFQTGTFKGAVNPRTAKFSDLPDFVEKNLDPAKHKRVAMFCTGGIRCEKFAPYMKQLGFEEVYQLKGGILKYLEEVPSEQSLWQGECFVFDDRVSIDHDLKKGQSSDLSQEPGN